MKTLLETDRMVFREFTEDDLELIVELDSDPEVVKFIADGLPTPREVIVETVLPRYLEFHQQGKGFGYWAVIEKASNEFAGWFHLRPNRQDETQIELGYRLAKRFWGKGLATEGARALLDYGIKSLGLHRVVAHAIKRNAASIRVMEKIGMSYVKDYQEDRYVGEDKRAVQYVYEE